MKGRLTVLFVIGVMMGLLGFSAGHWWLGAPLGVGAESAGTEALATPSLQNFESLEELESWLLNDEADEVIARSPMWCGEAAEMLISRAEASGYRLSMDVINYEEYNEFYEATLTEGFAHTVCSATIGDEVYYIEPRTDKVWYFGMVMR